MYNFVSAYLLFYLFVILLMLICHFRFMRSVTQMVFIIKLEGELFILYSLNDYDSIADGYGICFTNTLRKPI